MAKKSPKRAKPKTTPIRAAGVEPMLVDGIDVRVPAFLREAAIAQARSPEEKRRIISQSINPHADRQWIMPDLSKYPDVNTNPGSGEEDVAKKKAKAADAAAPAKPEINCADPDLPVEVNLTFESGPSKEFKFANLSEFIEFFDPKQHLVEGSIGDPSVTMISLRQNPASVKKADKTTGTPPAASTTTRGAVIKKGREPKTEGVKPRGVGFTRHKVKVGKETYGSVYKAFEALKLSIPAHTKFRAQLKQAKGGTMNYEEKGKTYLFELVEA